MQRPAQAERPYRSHLRPACVPCRRRKSRCQTEAGARICLMCRAHRTECFFPEGAEVEGESGVGGRRRAGLSFRGRGRTETRSRLDMASRASTRKRRTETAHEPSSKQPPTHPTTQPPEDVSLTLGSAEDQHLNMHIVGPVTTNDSQVLSDYLSGIPGATRSTRMIVPEPASRSRPVLFTMVRKRPVGVTVKASLSAEKLEIIEKLLEPCAGDLIDEYFKKVNVCLPLLDETSFRRQFRENKDNISPALLACLYAHTLIYWNHSPTLRHHRCPDSRYIWNLASEAVYSELYLSPGVSIISAILLNIGGRPTTSLIGNGVLLGSAVSMAHSLGLNRSPLPWGIALSEKYLRMKIWWSLLLHDRWTSLAHGTPPHILRGQYDVPLPTLAHLVEDGSSERRKSAASVFIAFMSLTDVLDCLLRHVHHVGKDKAQSIDRLELLLNSWLESLDDAPRRIIITRDLCIDVSGAASLNLAYLTTRLLLQRIELEAEKQEDKPNEDRLTNCHIQARRTAEEILTFTQNLQPGHLSDFWLSVSAFVFPTTVNFLLRCALETETTPAGLSQSKSFKIARDLVDTLRQHQGEFEWDLADLCIAQHAEVVDKVLSGATQDGEGVGEGAFDLQELMFSDAAVLEEFFSGAWDPLEGAW